MSFPRGYFRENDNIKGPTAVFGGIHERLIKIELSLMRNFFIHSKFANPNRGCVSRTSIRILWTTTEAVWAAPYVSRLHRTKDIPRANGSS